jgi:hypothetical protein
MSYAGGLWGIYEDLRMTGQHYSPHYARDLGYSSPAKTVRREETGMKRC